LFYLTVIQPENVVLF